jgi:hypothetical protein
MKLIANQSWRVTALAASLDFLNRSGRQLARRINSAVCLVIALCCVAIVPFDFQNFQSAASQGRQLPYSIECEDWVSSAKVSAGNLVRQEMGAFGKGWSGNAQLFWTPPPPVDTPIRNWPHLTHLYTAPADGTYDVILHYTIAPDYGMFRVFIEGQAAGDVDGYAAAVAPKSRSLGQHKLKAGSHQLVVTVFSKASSSKNFFVGLDRLELRRVDLTSRNLGDAGSEPAKAQATPPSGGQGDNRFPDLAAICAAKPETCCPSGQTTSEGCRAVTASMLDIRLRSYVPPRFTVMGKMSPWGTDWEMDNIVADRDVSGPYKVWRGCRFNVTEANNAIDDSKSVLQKASELAEAWLKQWHGGVESAKTFVSQNVANEFCKQVDDSETCRKDVEPVVMWGINAGLISLGIPPEIPDIQQLREQGIRYLAAEAASSAIGDPKYLEKLPVGKEARDAIYQKLYDTALDKLSKELNKAIPSPNFNSDNPVTWGHLDPAYAPHNAHAYIDVRIKPGAYSKYLNFIASKPTHKWQPLYLHDLNRVWASVGPIEIPAFIPQNGVILPIELKPFDVAGSKADTVVEAQIPRIKISRNWLAQKFGLSVDGLVKAQINWEGPQGINGYLGSDWDLFYDPVYSVKVGDERKSNFRLLMPIGTSNKGVLDWETNWEVMVANVWDVEAKYGVATKTTAESGTLHNYVGRIDPAPRCDGKPNLFYGVTWKPVTGCATDIGVDANGIAWVVGCSEGSIHRWNIKMQNFDRMDGVAQRIAVEPGGRPWVVNDEGKIYKRTGETDWKKSGGNHWEPVEGCAKDIGIDQSGEVWIIACTGGTGLGNFGLRHGKGDGKWTPVSGGGLRISAAPDGTPWLVNGDGNIYRRSNDQWGDPLPGCARDIAAYGRNSAWAVGCSKTGANYSIHRWDEGNKKWILYDGVAAQIAVEPNGRPWIVTRNGAIWVRVQKDY